MITDGVYVDWFFWMNGVIVCMCASNGCVKKEKEKKKGYCQCDRFFLDNSWWIVRIIFFKWLFVC